METTGRRVSRSSSHRFTSRLVVVVPVVVMTLLFVMQKSFVDCFLIQNPPNSLQQPIRAVVSQYTQHHTLRSHSDSDTIEPTPANRNLPWTYDDVMTFADQSGVILSLSTLGPGYRVVARAKHDESMILGYVEGFLRPSGTILHLDKMQVFQPMVEKAKRQQPNILDFGGVSFALGLVMGYRCLLFGQEKGCSIAEFLAIDDEEFQHKRLVRYYRQAGFRVIKYVGEEFKDIPDRLIWGGCGTLMREDVDVLIRKWTDIFMRMKEKAKNP